MKNEILKIKKGDVRAIDTCGTTKECVCDFGDRWQIKKNGEIFMAEMNGRI